MSTTPSLEERDCYGELHEQCKAPVCQLLLQSAQVGLQPILVNRGVRLFEGGQDLEGWYVIKYLHMVTLLWERGKLTSSVYR